MIRRVSRRFRGAVAHGQIQPLEPREWTKGAMPNGRFEADAQIELAYSTVKGAVVPEVQSPCGRAA
jgi:hypothetical protein